MNGLFSKVFEATTTVDDDDDVGVDRFNEVGDNYQPEKSTVSRRNLLDELKSVLSVRSTTMHEREMRALASRRGVPLEDLIKEEEANQSNAASDVRRFNWANGDKLPSSNCIRRSSFTFSLRKSSDDADEEDWKPSDVAFAKNLSDELRLALIARRSAATGSNYEEQIGDGDD